LWITVTSAYKNQTCIQPTWIIACFAVRSRKIRHMQDKQTYILRIIRSGKRAVVGKGRHTDFIAFAYFQAFPRRYDQMGHNGFPVQ